MQLVCIGAVKPLTGMHYLHMSIQAAHIGQCIACTLQQLALEHDHSLSAVCPLRYKDD
jgi:hypothetical protein